MMSHVVQRTAAVMTAITLAACSSGSEPGSPRPTSGSVTVIVDSLSAPAVGGIHFHGPDGADHYVQAKQGPNVLLAGTAFGAYHLAFDTVWFADTGIPNGGVYFDASRWTATPISADAVIDAANPDDTVRVVYRKLTGGVDVTATGNPELWVEFLRPDGTGCQCTSHSGNGVRTFGHVTMQNLLPGTWQVHFLPIAYFPTPGGSGSLYTMIPSPAVVTVTVTAGQITQASTVYTRQ